MENGLFWWLQGVLIGFVDEDGYVNVIVLVVFVIVFVFGGFENIMGMGVYSIWDYRY